MFGKKNPNVPSLLILDVGSFDRLVADYYQFASKEAKCKIEFMDLPNNTALQDALSNALKYYTPGKTDSPWGSAIKKSIASANSVAFRLAAEGRSVMIQGHRKSLIHFVILSLTQLLMDPFYRTTFGFCLLIEKDWVQYTFPFGCALSVRLNKKNSKIYSTNLFFSPPTHTAHLVSTKERGTYPHFELFLHCVWSLLNLAPTKFEFTDSLLHFLAENYSSFRFGTFYCNSLEDIMEKHDMTRTSPSIWTHILNNALEFKNPDFLPFTEEITKAGGRLVLVVCRKLISYQISPNCSSLRTLLFLIIYYGTSISLNTTRSI